VNTKVEVPAKAKDSSQDAREQEPEPTQRREGHLPARPIMRAAMPPPNGSLREAHAASMIGSPNLGASARARMTGALQRSVGNSRVARLAGEPNEASSSLTAQAKLTVNTPGDAYEREADGVADRMTRSGRQPMSVGRISRLPSYGMPTSANHQAKKEDAVSGGLDSSMEARIQSPAIGRPLAPDLQREMESRLGTDLSAVRVHDSAHDRADADRLNAKAFTHGNDIWIGSQGSGEDRKLMAHELTHVVQQTGSESGATASTPVLRWPLTDDRTDRQKIDDAIRSHDPADVKAISNVYAATEAERIELLRILTYQGWVGARDEWKIEEIWRSFKDIPETYKQNPLLWQAGIDGGADLDKLSVVKAAHAKFMTDVQAIALDYLNKNEAYIQSEMKKYGIDEVAPTEQQNQNVKELQQIAEQVRIAQENEMKLENIRVGSSWTSGFEQGYPWAAKVPKLFDPKDPPGENLDGETANKDRDWQAVKQVWDPLAAFITTIANRYPAIYAAIQQSQSIWGRDDKVGPVAQAPEPAKARQLIGEVLKETLKNIREARPKILRNDPDYRDMLPIHAQMIAGTVPVPSNTDWNHPFYSWVMKSDMAGYKVREFWTRLGLQTAAAAAFVVVELASFGTATFFIAAGVGLASSGALAVNSVEQYLNLERLAKSSASDATALVDNASVVRAGMQAIADVIQFLAMLTRVGTKAAGALFKPKMATAPIEKFRDYIFKPGATHGKDPIFRKLGYGPEDSAELSGIYQKQAGAKYASGNYTLGKKDKWGQRIDIVIDLPGKGAAAGQQSRLVSGWMIREDGTISLNTPFSGHPD
jgi:hypothetical protein